MPDLRHLWPLLLLAACGRAVPRESLETTRATRLARSSTETPDTAVYVARQAGAPIPAPRSTVMLLRVGARDAQVTVENPAGQRASSSAPGAEAIEQIPGSRTATVTDATPDSTALPAAWSATVTAPVLVGEHYLVELLPTTPRLDSAFVELSADGSRLARAHVAIDATSGVPALFEVTVGDGRLAIGPQIDFVEIVPSCGTTHLARSFGRADLYARYEVLETGERGDIHLTPRADDARFRSTSFRTTTRGGVRISYLGHVLATSPLPADCDKS
jgi:hypothetical protein